MATKPLSIVLFFIGLLLFNWPVLSIAGQSSTLASYLFLFIAWALIIVLSFLLPNHFRAKPQSPDDKFTRG